MMTCSQDVANGDAEAASPAAPNPPATPASEAAPPPVAATPDADQIKPDSRAAGAQEAGAREASPRPGARPLNVSNLKHGLHAAPEKQALRLVLGKLTDKEHQALKGVEDDAYDYRKLIEAACMDAHGQIGIVQAHLIDTAVRWFRHGQAAGLWLRTNEDKLDPAQKLAFSKAIAEAAERRDKSVAQLDLAASSGVDDWYAALRAGALDIAAAPGKAAAAENGPGDNQPEQAPVPEDHQPNHDPQ